MLTTKLSCDWSCLVSTLITHCFTTCLSLQRKKLKYSIFINFILLHTSFLQVCNDCCQAYANFVMYYNHLTWVTVDKDMDGKGSSIAMLKKNPKESWIISLLQPFSITSTGCHKTNLYVHAFITQRLMGIKGQNVITIPWHLLSLTHN